MLPKSRVGETVKTVLPSRRELTLALQAGCKNASFCVRTHHFAPSTLGPSPAALNVQRPSSEPPASPQRAPSDPPASPQRDPSETPAQPQRPPGRPQRHPSKAPVRSQRDLGDLFVLAAHECLFFIFFLVTAAPFIGFCRPELLEARVHPTTFK